MAVDSDSGLGPPKKSKRLFVRLAAILAVLAAIASTALTLSNHRRIKICSKCSTVWSVHRFNALSVTVFESAEESSNSLVDYRESLLGPCTHDWSFCAGQTYRPFRGTEMACGFPASRDPILRLIHPDCDGTLIDMIGELPTVDDRKRAFLAMGDSENHLRFLAYGSVVALYQHKASSSNLDAWWRFWNLHKELLAVEHDACRARAVAEACLGSDNPIIVAHAEEVLKALEHHPTDE